VIGPESEAAQYDLVEFVRQIAASMDAIRLIWRGGLLASA
jgi:hypothetical protein